MRVLIVHDTIRDAASTDAADVLVAASMVRDRLETLGHTVSTIESSLDLAPIRHAAESADVVFNLVESLDGRGVFIHLVPMLIEAIGVPMTGCPATAIRTTSNKLITKQLLEANGLPTPSAVISGEAVDHGRWIVKSVWEHASIGLDDDAVVDAASRCLETALRQARSGPRGDVFAERYIDGREFNLSLIEIDGEPCILPPAEIEFVGFGAERPRIVGYAAKWDPDSFAYNHTPRRFAFPSSDGPLLDTLRDLALRCWHLFGLRGYARVDFRVDRTGIPWILEINANPCLSPDAGFLAAAQEAGWSSFEVIRRIIAASIAQPPERTRSFARLNPDEVNRAAPCRQGAMTPCGGERT